MIKAELSYNPYLNETSIKFNDQPPRVNSLVEKYQDEILNDWIDKIPSIFHDEMNGYGFELDFSGTELDYRNLQNAFLKKGITDEDVQIFYKNELESRSTKVERFENLLIWFQEHPNRLFDFDAFKEANSDILNDLYIYKILQGEGIDAETLKDQDIAVENISDVKELELTNLKNIPVLVYISERSVGDLKRNTRYLLGRKDVRLNQLFFYIAPECDTEKIIRVIKDLGVVNPQIVASIYDESIKSYFELYPITEYIIQSICITRKMTCSVQDDLERQSKDNQVSERKAIIQKFDKRIQSLKKVDDAFVNRDNLDVPMSFLVAKSDLISNLTNWRNRKTVITKDGDAFQAAQEYEVLFRNSYETFWNAINHELLLEEEGVKKRYQSLYASAGVDTQFVPEIEYTSKVTSVTVPEVKDALLAIKEEKYVVPKEGIIDQVFKTNANTNKMMEKVNYYYYKNWREHVVNIAEEISNRAIAARVTFLRKYADELAEKYHTHILQLLDVENQNKANEVGQLSEVERQMQIDIDWLNSVVEQISAIERG